MAKRFFDSDKFDKIWYRKLTPSMKCLWELMLCKCDIAGVWRPDWDLVSFLIGKKIDPVAALMAMGKQIDVLPCGKWWITDFIFFQYGKLSEASRPHIAVISILKKHNLYQRVLEGFTNPLDTLKDKDKDKDQDQDKDKSNGRMKTPTQKQCQDYAVHLGIPESVGDKFFNFYESKGWMVGKNPMRKWEAAMVNWRTKWRSENDSGSNDKRPDASITRLRAKPGKYDHLLPDKE